MSLPVGSFVSVLIGLIGLFGLVSTSAGASPPAVDQYVEQLPSPGGERPAGADGDSSAGGLESGALTALLALGDEGARAAAIFGSLETGTSSGSRAEPADTATDDFSFGDVIGASSLGGSGTSFLLPLSMLAIFVLGVFVRQLGRSPEAKGPSASD